MIKATLVEHRKMGKKNGVQQYYIRGHCGPGQLPENTETELIYNGSEMQVIDSDAKSLTVFIYDADEDEWVPVATVSAEDGA